MTDINQLIDELREMIDDERFRVNDLFQRIRDAVPRPITLVFEAVIGRPRLFRCHTHFGCYEYVRMDNGRCVGDCNDFVRFEDTSEPGIVAAMQSHFNAAWSAMTAKGAAT